jgi:3-oxoadipate enol-lactonase
MGGMIGIWLGAHAPKRLHRLVLSNTAARIGTKETWNNRIATARKDGLGPIAAGVIERWFTPEFRAAHPQRVATTQRMLENSPPEGYASCCAAIRDMDQTEMISKIEGPTLVIYGAKDPVTPPADAHFLTSHIRGAKGVELDAAHLSNVEQAAVFTESLRRFLAE